MNTCSDEQLMSFLVGEGDLKAFEELITRYEQSLFNYIYRYIQIHGGFSYGGGPLLGNLLSHFQE